MTIEVSEAIEHARAVGSGGPADRFLELLAERVGARAGVHAVFGEPIEQGDLTIVPVARVRWGFGGGHGSADDATSGSGSGSGGGGGVSADPIGYIQLTPDGATFERIGETSPSPMLVLAAGLAAAMILRAVARLMRR